MVEQDVSLSFILFEENLSVPIFFFRYQRKITLAGILYFHRISDNRMARSPLKNLRMFQELCGKKALQNVVLVTTMWDEVNEAVGVQMEKELKDKYWKVIDRGSATARFHVDNPLCSGSKSS
jgi:hypothetical protein